MDKVGEKMDWKLAVLSVCVVLASWIWTKNNFGPLRSHENDCNMTYMWRQMNYMVSKIKEKQIMILFLQTTKMSISRSFVIFKAH